MSQQLQLQINGKPRMVEAPDPSALDRLLDLLELRADRIAVELNGNIVPRSVWPATEVHDGDRLEVVHFVGGGADAETR